MNTTAIKRFLQDPVKVDRALAVAITVISVLRMVNRARASAAGKAQ